MFITMIRDLDESDNLIELSTCNVYNNVELLLYECQMS